MVKVLDICHLVREVALAFLKAKTGTIGQGEARVGQGGAYRSGHSPWEAGVTLVRGLLGNVEVYDVIVFLLKVL